MRMDCEFSPASGGCHQVVQQGALEEHQPAVVLQPGEGGDVAGVQGIAGLGPLQVFGQGRVEQDRPSAESSSRQLSARIRN